MTTIFKKLNFKDQGSIHVLNSPESFAPELKSMQSVTDVQTELKKGVTVNFFLAFVTKQIEVDALAEKVAPMLTSGAVFWFAYPKGSSKRYKCEFNRDTGWKKLGDLGFEGVRMVAIDEDWSALRFKKAEHIKSMTRSFAMSETGKQKVGNKSKRN